MLNTENRVVLSGRFDQENKGQRDSLPAMKKGEILSGRVTRSVSSRHAILLIKGKEVVARTPGLLKPGDVALFKVEQVSPEYVLRLVKVGAGQDPQLAELVKGARLRGLAYKSIIDLLNPLMADPHKSESREFPDVLRRMWDLLCRISLHPEKEVSTSFLKSFIDHSGMMLEHKLKLWLSGVHSGREIQSALEEDLKGLAFRSLGDSRAMSLVSAEGASRFIDALEQLQLLNLTALEEKGKLLLVMPMQWDGEFSFAQLLIDLSGKSGREFGEKDQEGVLRLSLFLEMSHLGPVRVDASLFQKVVRVGLMVCNDDVKAFFENASDDLKGQLEKHGFSVQEITCLLERKSRLAETSLVEALLDPETHRISIVI